MSAKLELLFKKLKERNIEISEQKTKLWGSPDYIVKGLDEFDFYVSQKYEGSAFIVARLETGSKMIPFAADEFSPAQLAEYPADKERKGLVPPKYVDFKVNVGIVTALRDDEDFGISEGDEAVKAYVA